MLPITHNLSRKQMELIGRGTWTKEELENRRKQLPRLNALPLPGFAPGTWHSSALWVDPLDNGAFEVALRGGQKGPSVIVNGESMDPPLQDFSEWGLTFEQGEWTGFRH
jgi:hypothetical protein